MNCATTGVIEVHSGDVLVVRVVRATGVGSKFLVASYLWHGQSWF